MRESIASDALRFFVGDVRDQSRLRRALHGVDTVIHAAALKRVEVGEYNPGEMIATNIGGAQNLIDAATDAGVERVIGISTDKAYMPVNMYGASKLVAEKLLLNANNARGADGPIFAVVRYGNVWGSTGSIVPRWRALIGKPLKITDPECTRYYLSIDGAVDLVLDVAETMRGGELVIPTLPAYRLGDLAEAFGGPVEVIGLPASEKRHESMGPNDSSGTAPRLSVAQLRAMLATV